MTRPPAVALALVFLLASCGEDSPGGASVFINVGLQNSTNESLSVSLTSRHEGEIIEEKSLTVAGLGSPSSGYTATEIAGLVGTQVLIQATGPGGLLGSVTCIATAEIVGTSTYGQVNIIGGGGTSLSMDCLPPWA